MLFRSTALLLGCSGWAYYCYKKNSSLLIIPLLVVQMALFTVFMRLASLNPDEVEHLHCAWLVGQGMLPFRDFWQHHSPFLWVLLAPLMKIMAPSAGILGVSRCGSLAVSAVSVVIGWLIARKVWRQEAHLPTYLLMIFSAGGSAEFFVLRPDIFMTLFLLMGIYVALFISEKGSLPAFIAGMFFAFAASFICKQYCMALLPPIVLLIYKRRGALCRGLLAYGAGLGIGAVPLAGYLAKNHIAKEFIAWVFVSNKERIVVNLLFPLGFLLVGGWGLWLLYRTFRRTGQATALIFLIVFFLSTASSFTGSIFPAGGYYLQLWFVLCAIAASGGIFARMADAVTPVFKKSLAIGAVFSLLITPSAIFAYGHRHNGFACDKAAIDRLIAYSRGDSCFALLPGHPIFCHDVTRVYSPWQYARSDWYQNLRDDIKSAPVARAFFEHPPAVVIAYQNNQPILTDLFSKEFISEDDMQAMSALLESTYVLKEIGWGQYYIRKDRA